MSEAQIERRPRYQVVGQAGTPRENQLPPEPFDMTPLLTGLRTQKSLRQPNGTFLLRTTFQSVGEAARLLNPILGPVAEERSGNLVFVPENMVDIALDPGVKGSEMESVMQGTITRIFATTDMGDDGEPAREIVLAGEDWGKILVRHTLPAHLLTAWLQGEAEIGARDEAGAMLFGTPGDVCQKLFRFIFLDKLEALRLALRDIYYLDIDDDLFDLRAGWMASEGVWFRQGKFWSELQGLADEPWNELFADYYERYTPMGPTNGGPVPSDSGTEVHDRFVLRLRRRPFTQEKWEQLPTHTIRDEELKHHDETLSDDERANWVTVEPAWTTRGISELPAEQVYLRGQRYDELDAEAHGAQRLNLRTAYLDLPSGRNGTSLARDPAEHDRMSQGQGELFAALSARTQDAWDWYSINHRLWRASWISPLRPEIKIGHRVQNQRDPSDVFVMQEDERRVYYCEEVVHDVADGRHALTHYGLTRGMPIDRFLTPHVDGRVL